MKTVSRLFLVVLFFSVAQGAKADSDDRAFPSPTPNLYGMIGLNTVPSARMDKTGTVRLSFGTADPYLHTQLGFQATDRLYLGLRQSAEVSSLRDDPKHVFPGLDLKLKLFDERTFRPEISLGMQSVLGHKRMSGEFLAFSKRYEDFDFTAGVGWGRFGTRNSVPNPLDWTGSYLADDRDLDGEKPNAPKDWFSGDTGFFAGIEYATPWRGLSLKADWSSDSYKAERAIGIDAPSAFSFGLSYQPTPWVDAGIAVLDKDTVMARISFKSLVSQWPFSPSDKEPLIGLAPDPKDKNIVSEAKAHGLTIRNILPNDTGMSGQLYLNPGQSTPHQLSQAWRIITNKTGQENPDMLRLEPVYFGLRGPGITISRRDLQEEAKNNGSAEEIWRHVTYDNKLSDPNRKISKFIPFLTLRENFSMSEDDGGIYHRTDILGTLTHQFHNNFLIETSLRYNLFSNLSRLTNIRPAMTSPIRSDEAYYAERSLALDRGFMQGFRSFTPNLHISGSVGYLEEMFAGYHGEILYRPFAKNWAVGLEASDVFKRDYDSELNMGLIGDAHMTSHLNLYYEFPDTDMTLHASIGHYLGGDNGGSLSLKNRFANGATFEALITATNMSDPDVYGGAENVYAGFKFALPLGSIKYIPDGSAIELNALPVARDAGQRLNIAHPLYDMTEPLSYRHLTQTWMDVTH